MSEKKIGRPSGSGSKWAVPTHAVKVPKDLNADAIASLLELRELLHRHLSSEIEYLPGSVRFEAVLKERYALLDIMVSTIPDARVSLEMIGVNVPQSIERSLPELPPI